MLALLSVLLAVHHTEYIRPRGLLSLFLLSLFADCEEVLFCRLVLSASCEYLFTVANRPRLASISRKKECCNNSMRTLRSTYARDHDPYKEPDEEESISIIHNVNMTFAALESFIADLPSPESEYQSGNKRFEKALSQPMSFSADDHTPSPLVFITLGR